MANITIDQLPPASSLDGTERVPINKHTGTGYTTEYTTIGAIAVAGIQAASLPTTLPAQPGILWNNGGVLSIS